MASLIDNILPGGGGDDDSSTSRSPILNPGLGGSNDDVPVSSSVGDEENTQTRTGPPAASPTPDTDSDDEENDDDNTADDSDEEDDNEENDASPSRPLPDNENGAVLEPSTSLSLSDLPSEITPPATLLPSVTPSRNPAEVTSSAISGDQDDDASQADDNEQLIVAPSPTSLPIPDAEISSIIMTTVAPPASSSISAPGEAESAVSGNEGGGGGDDGLETRLMPALPIGLGAAGGALLIGAVFGTLYKKGKWPFKSKKSKNFEELDDGELEKQLQRRWDPRNGAVNF